MSRSFPQAEREKKGFLGQGSVIGQGRGESGSAGTIGRYRKRKCWVRRLAHAMWFETTSFKQLGAKDEPCLGLSSEE